MGVATVLLVRYQGGYIEVDDPAAVAQWGRKEGFLQLGSVVEETQAVRVAEAVLAFQSSPRVATTMGIEPSGNGDAPFVDFGVGDTISAPEADGTTTSQKVVSLTVAEDENGEVSFANELKATFLVREEALDNQLKKLLNGSMRGQSVAANPLPTGSVTRAQNGDSIGALREYVNAQLLDRIVAAHTSANSNTQTGGTWTPGTTQLKFFAEVRAGTTGSAGSAGRVVFSFPDGGFANQCLIVAPYMADFVAGVGGVIVNIVDSNTTKAQFDCLIIDTAGAGLVSKSVSVGYWAIGW